jgi:diguanylate cyclase (GGDEF)-like protein
MDDRGILIVDDSASLRGMVKTILSGEGLFQRFYEAEDGVDALNFMKSGCDLDFIIMDLLMPRMDGIRVLSWARDRKEYRDLPILLLSVDGSADIKAKGLNLGASDYVVKPFDPGELVARVRLLLKRKEVQDELRRKNEEMARINEELRKVSVIDDLTKLYNRSRFFEGLSQEMKRCARYKTRMTLLLIDLDDFKLVNDTCGHLAGDEVLKEVAGIMKGLLRDSDIAGRYGGEEFMLCLAQTDREGAMLAAERIRAAVQEKVFAFPEGTVRITASIGMAEFPNDNPIGRDELIRRADVALYEAKKTGKNKVAEYGG